MRLLVRAQETPCRHITDSQRQTFLKLIRSTVESGRENGFLQCSDGRTEQCNGTACHTVFTNPCSADVRFHTHPEPGPVDTLYKHFSPRDLYVGAREKDVINCVGYDEYGVAKVRCVFPTLDAIGGRALYAEKRDRSELIHFRRLETTIHRRIEELRRNPTPENQAEESKMLSELFERMKDFNKSRLAEIEDLEKEGNACVEELGTASPEEFIGTLEKWLSE